MVRLEKNKYMRERIYYQNAKQTVLYEQANNRYKLCRDEVTDNLVKQAKTICKPTPEEFDKYFKQFHIDNDSGNSHDIEKTISGGDCEKHFQTWQTIQEDFKRNKAKVMKIKDNSNLTDDDQKLVNQII